VTRIKRDQKIPLIGFVANTGGLLGLCMGFSLVSAFEIIYHCVLGGFRRLTGDQGHGKGGVMTSSTPPNAPPPPNAAAAAVLPHPSALTSPSCCYYFRCVHCDGQSSSDGSFGEADSSSHGGGGRCRTLKCFKWRRRKTKKSGAAVSRQTCQHLELDATPLATEEQEVGDGLEPLRRGLVVERWRAAAAAASAASASPSQEAAPAAAPAADETSYADCGRYSPLCSRV